MTIFLFTQTIISKPSGKCRSIKEIKLKYQLACKQCYLQDYRRWIMNFHHVSKQRSTQIALLKIDNNLCAF